MRSSKLPSSEPTQGPISANTIDTAFGLASPIFAETSKQLKEIYSQSRHIPQVAARFHEWQRFRGNAARDLAVDETTFINQTYLAILARLTARRFVAPNRIIADYEELLEVVNVDYFTRRGIGNFGEGDIFSWLIIEPRWGLNLGRLVLETVQKLADSIELYDFSEASSGVLDSLFQQMSPASASTPRWLAEYIIEDELGLTRDYSLSLVDPACGTGAFLCAAIRAMSRAIANSGGDQIDLLFIAPENIRGIDFDPISVALARLNYLLALGDLVQEEHPQFLMPLYLSDAAEPSPQPVSVITLATTIGDFPLPEAVIENPLMLDWVLGRLTNYMDGALLRLHVQQEEVAIQEVLNAYYNYLTAAKPRTPVPEALTPEQADTLLETARKLIQLHIRGDATLWLHLVQNMAAPMIFSRSRFDRLTGRCSAQKLDMGNASYLKEPSQAAVLMPFVEAERNSYGRRMVTLEDISPGTALMITTGEGRARLEFNAGPIQFDSSWENAKFNVRLVEES